MEPSEGDGDVKKNESKSKTVQKDEDEDDDDDANDFGWKVLLLVQFEVQFQAMLLVSCLASAAPAIYMFAFHIADNIHQISYSSGDISKYLLTQI